MNKFQAKVIDIKFSNESKVIYTDGAAKGNPRQVGMVL
jgi:hypothetical protein